MDCSGAQILQTAISFHLTASLSEVKKTSVLKMNYYEPYAKVLV